MKKSLVVLCFLLTSCSDRFLTEQLWQTDSQYYILSKSEISAEQNIDLHKSADGYKLIETQSDFYVKKNWINYYGDLSVKIVATPVTVSLDMATIYVVGIVSNPQAMINIIDIAASGHHR